MLIAAPFAAGADQEKATDVDVVAPHDGALGTDGRPATVVHVRPVDALEHPMELHAITVSTYGVTGDSPVYVYDVTPPPSETKALPSR